MRECLKGIGMAEAVHDEQTLQLVAPETAKKLVNKILKILKHKQVPLKTKTAALDMIGELTLTKKERDN